MTAITTSVTLASSISLRLRALAGRIHTLGPRASFEAMCEIVGGADPMETYERYAALTLHADLLEAHGGRDLPPTIFRIK